MAKDTASRNTGIGFLSLLGLLFIALKLLDKIDWSWIWVLAPLWAPTAIWVSLLILGLGIGYAANRKKIKVMDARIAEIMLENPGMDKSTAQMEWMKEEYRKAKPINSIPSRWQQRIEDMKAEQMARMEQQKKPQQ